MNQRLWNGSKLKNFYRTVNDLKSGVEIVSQEKRKDTIFLINNNFYPVRNRRLNERNLEKVQYMSYWTN